MAHWFDRLAQPHTRRTAVKAGALAGMALAIPVDRLQSPAEAAPLPCFNACLTEAKVEYNNAYHACFHSAGGALALSFANVFGGAVLHGLEHWRELECRADAIAGWRQAAAQCRLPECGDKGKYPGGNPPGTTGKPSPNCDPQQEIQCGDRCCNATGHPECCFCPKVGEFQCCANGSNCGCCGR